MTLDISNAQIHWIDDELIEQHFDYSPLKLYADNNKIMFTNPIIFFLWNRLTSIDLSFNKIIFIPEYISNLKNLQRLNVENNLLTSLPHTLLEIPLFAATIAQEPLSEQESFHLLINGNPFIDKEMFAISTRFPFSASKVVKDLAPILHDMKTRIEALNGTSHVPKTHVDVLYNRMKGCLFGHAVGDALGLLTEFMDAATVCNHYGDFVAPAEGRYLHYYHCISDQHRSIWQTGDFTDDTDQMILLLDSICERGASPLDIFDFARRLERWAFQGFTELGDNSGKGIGDMTSTVIRHQLFSSNPKLASVLVAGERGKNYSAGNGGLMRNSVMALPMFWNEDLVIQNTRIACNSTHADPRCVASCIVMSIVIRSLLMDVESNMTREGWLNDVLEHAYTLSCREFVDQEEYAKELRHYLFIPEELQIEALSLDNTHMGIGYTFRCLSSGIWCLRKLLTGMRKLLPSIDKEEERNCIKTELFRGILNELVMQGGDADTNGAVAGALMGCAIGYSCIPDELINELVHQTWLEFKIDRLLDKIIQQDE